MVKEFGFWLIFLQTIMMFCQFNHIFCCHCQTILSLHYSQFVFGHTHRTQYSVYYSTNDTSKIEDALTVSWVNPSVTPYTNFNPGFRYYEVENESFNIRNSFSYYFDLNGTFTNSGNEPTWKLEYSARESYDPKGLGQKMLLSMVLSGIHMSPNTCGIPLIPISIKNL